MKEMGATINARMGLNTWAAFYGSDADAVVAGDVAMLDAEVTPVLKALRANGIDVVAIHHHMTGTEPDVYFLHYWGKGPAQKLATAVKAASTSWVSRTRPVAERLLVSGRLPRDAALVCVAGSLRAAAVSLVGVIIAIHLAGRGLSTAAVGLVIATGIAVSALGTVVVGMRADRWGRRRTLIVLGLLADPATSRSHSPVPWRCSLPLRPWRC